MWREHYKRTLYVYKYLLCHLLYVVQGRVTEVSVKNFQLCSSETGDDIVLQFGRSVCHSLCIRLSLTMYSPVTHYVSPVTHCRTGKQSFSMDVAYPLSLFQAFAICVACMDEKIADRQV